MCVTTYPCSNLFPNLASLLVKKRTTGNNFCKSMMICPITYVISTAILTSLVWSEGRIRNHQGTLTKHVWLEVRTVPAHGKASIYTGAYFTGITKVGPGISAKLARVLDNGICLIIWDYPGIGFHYIMAICYPALTKRQSLYRGFI